MDVQPTACDRRIMERFFADRLSDAELAAFEDHLGGCAACRQRLDGLAAERSWWEEARGHLESATLSSPSAGAFAPGVAPGGDETADDPLSLVELIRTYLAPSEDPRMLGRLGGYEIVGVIGYGGMGIVLKALDAPLNRYVAIKVLGPQLALSGTARQRFAREAKAAATVVHPNVMAIHAVAETKSLPYFVMPYVRGPSLAKRLQQTGAFTVLEIVRIGMQMAGGLAAAHAQGLVHRDIKPANILLEEGVERVTLTDFGLARAVDDASLTRSGVIAGTPQYMSPEQASGKPIDHRSDLFSLGSVLYALCTGRPPFEAETSLAVLRRVAEDQPFSIREINPEVPGWLAAIVERLQAKDPAARFQSAAEVAALLEAYLAHLQQPTTVPPPPLPSAPLPSSSRPARMSRPADSCPRRRGRPLALLVSVVLALFGLGGSYLILKALFQEEPPAIDADHAVAILEKLGGKITQEDDGVPRVIYGTGFYGEERLNGKAWHWMAEEGVVKLRNLRSDMTLRIAGRAPLDAMPAPPTMKISLNGEELEELVPPGNIFVKEYQIPSAKLGAGAWSELRISTTTVIVPSELKKKLNDNRRLGFQVYELTWEGEPGAVTVPLPVLEEQPVVTRGPWLAVTLILTLIFVVALASARYRHRRSAKSPDG
jgi:serine/threonine protein kinase